MSTSFEKFLKKLFEKLLKTFGGHVEFIRCKVITKAFYLFCIARMLIFVKRALTCVTCIFAVMYFPAQYLDPTLFYETEHRQIPHER